MDAKNNEDCTNEFIRIIKDLLAVYAPSGREEKVREIVTREIRDIGYKYEIDPAGNVLVRLPSNALESKNPVIIAAHMDEIAMVVTEIEANGDLKVINSGGLLPFKLGESPVEIISDFDGKNIMGVSSIAWSPSKVLSGGAYAISWDDVRIKTGLSAEQLKSRGIRAGSHAVPIKDMRGHYIFGDENDPMISAWTFDDRAGVAELLIVLRLIKTMELTFNKSIIIAFTVHEEDGCHGAKIVAHREKPEIFIAIDGCPVINENLKLDGRPGVWSKDVLCNYDPCLIVSLMNAAIEAGTELQSVVYPNSSSDASGVYTTGGAYKIAFLGHVRVNSHGYEVARLSVFNNTVKTLLKYIELNFS